MLRGTRIEDTLIGGPSFGILFKGDEILAIDGDPVTSDSVLDALKGSDIPGSKVDIRVRRKKTNAEEVSEDSPTRKRIELSVEVTRMATADIADHRRIFDLFTVFKVTIDRLQRLVFKERCDMVYLIHRTELQSTRIPKL
jgi:hypothetical protein